MVSTINNRLGIYTHFNDGIILELASSPDCSLHGISGFDEFMKITHYSKKIKTHLTAYKSLHLNSLILFWSTKA